MAAVFDGKTKVGRAVSDPGSDDTLPNPGSLVFGAISTPVALSGTVGAEGKLIHGDRWEQLDGSLMEITNTNVTTTIMGNQTHSVMGNQSLTTSGNVEKTVVGNMTATIIGPELHTNMNVQNHTRMTARTEIHLGQKQTAEPGTFMESVVTFVRNHIFDSATLATRVQLIGASSEVFGFRLQAIQMQTEVKEGDFGFHVLKMKSGGVSNLIDALRAKLSAGYAMTRAIQTDLGARVQVPPESIPGIE